ncbi:hypothetical protein CRG98_041186 [Punica granatum]|uniref:Retrovirus-related Pol polyprotein from transposon TNT 1-94-like beta-barrel domain-containing protein n=1 Tax=Punica granatum TaxID=22663 RepID=A0A2I0I4N8_PUNGR|nr:hypothetical protein CRG98_041186 [Punica granatum]
MSGSKLEVEKFDGTNEFELWRVKMKMLLIHNELEGAISGINQLTSTLSLAEKKAAMSKALSIIMLSLGDKVLREVCDLTSPPKQCMYRLRMEPGTSMSDHIVRRTSITLEDVKASLNSRELKKKVHDGHSSNGDGLLTRGCSYHMCPNRELFATYQLIKGGRVLMGNNDACKENTVTGTTNVGSAEKDTKNTMLWRISERGMSKLSKRGLLNGLRTSLKKEFSAEACNTTTYLVNRSPSTTIECKTPNEKWTRSPTNYVDLKVFGCTTYAHVRDGKLYPRAKKCNILCMLMV